MSSLSYSASAPSDYPSANSSLHNVSSNPTLSSLNDPASNPLSSYHSSSIPSHLSGMNMGLNGNISSLLDANFRNRDTDREAAELDIGGVDVPEPLPFAPLNSSRFGNNGTGLTAPGINALQQSSIKSNVNVNVSNASASNPSSANAIWGSQWWGGNNNGQSGSGSSSTHISPGSGNSTSLHMNKLSSNTNSVVDAIPSVGMLQQQQHHNPQSSQTQQQHSHLHSFGPSTATSYGRGPSEDVWNHNNAASTVNMNVNMNMSMNSNANTRMNKLGWDSNPPLDSVSSSASSASSIWGTSYNNHSASTAPANLPPNRLFNTVNSANAMSMNASSNNNNVNTTNQWSNTGYHSGW